MPAKHFIVNPRTGDIQTLAEWEKYVNENSDVDITDAQCVLVIPEEGIPFAFPKKSLGSMDWESAAEAVKSAVVPLPDEFLAKFSTGVEVRLPSRAQGSWIGECNYALPDDELPDTTLDETLEAIGGEQFCGAIFWSSSRYSASLAWYFYGSTGYAYGTYLSDGYRALPVLLCPGAKRP